jgi:transcriptional regulator with PAS, ATPase and Fis domain
VLITGETGTGKEILANVIHGLSKRCDGPLVKINCGAIPTELLEAELFGYKKGAFTDARTNKPGRFHLAKGGTIVLDEIGDMPLPMQVKLLRAIETRQVDPLGGTSSESIDVRIVSSTNQDLWEITEKGLFRKDLFFRINVMNLVIPPLRERVEDIQLLADMFVQKYCQKNSLPNIRISSAAMELLLRYPFYGNVRELHNILEYAIIISKGSDITPSHLPGYVFKSKETHKGNQEKEYIQDVLRSCGNNKGMTASILNIDRSTLWRKMKKYQI